MEKIPNFKIIGRGTEEEKTKLLDISLKNLNDNRKNIPEKELDKLKSIEYPKSQLEIAAINFSNQYTSDLLEKAGVPNFDIPEDNYYIIPNDEYNKMFGSNSNGIAHNFKKSVVLNGTAVRNKPLFIAVVILHETIHSKSFLSTELNENQKAENFNILRDGVSVGSSQKWDSENSSGHTHFSGLLEAIVSSIEKRALTEIIKLPELQDEVARLNSPEILEKRKRISNKKNISVDDVIWVSDKTEDFNLTSYPRLRDLLDYLCNEIQKQFPDKYSNSEDVFQEFFNAQFNGKLLTIAKLVESTFGKGSFRILGNMSAEGNGAILHLETFKKLRLNNI